MKPKSNLRHPQANYAIVENIPGKPLVIRDLGPWDQYMTITNAAEFVVEELFEAGLLDNRRLFYYDSEGDLDELVIKDGRFYEFAAGGPTS
jgi:hypothetical protein